jgi:hypothetical protein
VEVAVAVNNRTLWALALLALPAGGCFLFDLGGDDDDGEEEPLAGVHVDAVLSNDTCGPTMTSAGAYTEYDVDLSRSGDRLVWDGPGGRFEAALSDDGEFCIELDAQWHVRDADEFYGVAACDMVRIERLCGALSFEGEGDEETVTGMTGRHDAAVSAATGADCRDQIGVGNGLYLALPCQVAYTLTGTPNE